MKDKRIIAIIVLAVVVAAGCAYRYTQFLIPEGNGTLLPQGHVVHGTGSYDGTGQVVGGDSDEHGCKGSAGYSWCATTQKCQRLWEEPCQTPATAEKKEIFCTADQRGADSCIAEYTPVCATVQVECIKAPCNPVKTTFSNPCSACSNPRVSSYSEGECPK